MPVSVAHNSAKVYRKKAFVQVFCTRKTAALLRPCLSGATKAATKTDVHEHRHVGSAACRCGEPGPGDVDIPASRPSLSSQPAATSP